MTTTTLPTKTRTEYPCGIADTGCSCLPMLRPGFGPDGTAYCFGCRHYHYNDAARTFVTVLGIEFGPMSDQDRQTFGGAPDNALIAFDGDAAYIYDPNGAGSINVVWVDDDGDPCAVKWTAAVVL